MNQGSPEFQNVDLQSRILAMLFYVSPILICGAFFILLYPPFLMLPGLSFLVQVALGVIGLLCMLLFPLVLWIRTRRISLFLDVHGKEAVNYHVVMIVVFLLPLMLMLYSFSSVYGAPAFGVNNPRHLETSFVVSQCVVLFLGVYIPFAALIGGIFALLGKKVRFPLIVRFLK